MRQYRLILSLILLTAMLPTLTALATPPKDGLVLHLDAHAVAGSGQPNPPTVAAWKDISGHGNDVTQAAAELQPKVQLQANMGWPAVVFGGTEYLDGPAVLPQGAKALTYVAVWERDAQPAGQFTGQVVVEQASPGTGRRASLLTTEHAHGFNGESNDQHELLPYTPGEFAVSVLRLEPNGVVTLLHNGAMGKGRVDSAKQNTGNDKLRIGGKVIGGELLRGAIAEILVYDRALSDAQLYQISAELGAKWNIKMDTRDPFQVAYAEKIRRNAANPERYTEPYRPQYHFTPIDGWMNDPNGLVYFRGQWHQFYQMGAETQGWGHAVSRDLLHWEQRVPALTRDEKGNIWSGSAVVDWHDSSGFFGGKPGLVCIYTYATPVENNRQMQGIAYSADGITFTKYAGNPVIPQLRYQPGQPDEPDFRDPKVFWYAPTQRWIMVVAGGTLRFFSSPNLRDWKFESINNDIHTECPDFFALPLDGDTTQMRWVLSGGGDWYRLGSFDGHKFTPETTAIPFNYGHDFYASQTWSDVPDGRRIMTTWLYNWGYDTWPTKPWSGGSMTLPYELKLRVTADGPRIFSTPVQETLALRQPVQNWATMSIAPGTNLLDGVIAKSVEIEAEFDVSGTATSFGFKVPKGSVEQTIIGYNSTDKKLFVDRRGAGFAQIPHFNALYEAPLVPQNNRVKLRLFLDANSVEVFGNDGAAVITAALLPDQQHNGLELFAVGGEAKLVSLKLYPLKSVWRDMSH